jgi:hypothetical protein
MRISSAPKNMSGLNSNRALAAATCEAIATLIPVAAHQVSVIDHLPDQPGSVIASDRITK